MAYLSPRRIVTKALLSLLPLVAAPACDAWDDRDRREQAEAICGPLPTDYYPGDADCIGAEEWWPDETTCCSSSWPVCDLATGEWGITYCDEWDVDAGVPDAALPDAPAGVPDGATGALDGGR